MPHWDKNGNEEWICQKGLHICTGKSFWVEHNSAVAKQLGCHGNVCAKCLENHKGDKFELLDHAVVELANQVGVESHHIYGELDKIPYPPHKGYRSQCTQMELLEMLQKAKPTIYKKWGCSNSPK